MNAAGPDEERAMFWTNRVVFLVMFGLPLAMPLHILVNHFTRTTWSWPVSLLYPEMLGTLLLLVFASRRTNLRRTWARILASDPSLRRIVLVAAAFTAWTAVCAIVQGAFPGYWIRSVLIGWVFPVLLAGAVLALGRRARSAAWQGLSAGVGVLLLESIVLYFMSFGIPHSFHELVFTNRTGRVWQGVKGGVYFGELTLGNVNDIAVFFAVAIAFASGYALDLAPRTRALPGVMIAFVAAALFLELLCYSRGVILCLLLVLMLLVLAAVASPPLRRRRLGLLVLVFAVFLGTAFSSSQSRQYWVAQLRLSDGSTSALREFMWSRALRAESVTKTYRESAPKVMSQAADEAIARAVPPPAATPSPPPVPKETPTPGSQTVRAETAAAAGSWMRRLIFGYGLGNYGLIIGATFEAGTHNMFLDAYVASGLPGLILFSGLWFMMLWRMGREGWRFLREPEPTSRDPGVPVPPVLLAVVVITVAGVIVNFKLETLGMMLNAAAVWLLIVTRPDPLETRPGRASGTPIPVAQSAPA